MDVLPTTAYHGCGRTGTLPVLSHARSGMTSMEMAATALQARLQSPGPLVPFGINGKRGEKERKKR